MEQDAKLMPLHQNGCRSSLPQLPPQPHTHTVAIKRPRCSRSLHHRLLLHLNQLHTQQHRPQIHTILILTLPRHLFRFLTVILLQYPQFRSVTATLLRHCSHRLPYHTTKELLELLFNVASMSFHMYHRLFRLQTRTDRPG